MKNVKRIEIVIEAIEEKTIIGLLEKHHIDGYTVYHNVGGNGERGEREDSVFGDKFQNVAFVVACDEKELTPFLETLRPILKQFGGMCLISDAQWLIHND